MPREASYGEVFNAFINVLHDAIDRFKPVVIGVEDAIPQKHNRAHTARLTLGLHAITDMVAVQERIKLVRPSVDRIRSAVVGRCRLTPLERAIRPRVTVKDIIVEPWIQARGWDIDNHNSRDAALGWAYLCGIRSRRTT